MGDYNQDFAHSWPEMYNKKTRERRARRMTTLLEDYYKTKNLKQFSVLDVGSSTGIIDNELAKRFKHVTGIDVDKNGVKYAKSKFKRKNLIFKVGDAMKLSFKENSFDVVICTQVYEHVPDSKVLFKEIYRVLKPGGVCYLAALNCFWPLEPHHKLYFLSYLPKSLGNIYVKITGKSEKYYENLLSYWGLRKQANMFKVHDYTGKILTEPTKFSYEDELPTTGWKSTLISGFSPFLKFCTPTFFWILEKPKTSS